MPSDHAWARFSNSLGARGLRWTGKLNVPVYRLSGGRVGGKVGRAPVLLLTTTGRRSGEPRTTPVVYLADGANAILIDTNAGNERLPAWSHNLKANPEAEVERGRSRQAVRARVATG
jgi:deazaflavin-dependent oxidoreductase (nitroreductase family)